MFCHECGKKVEGNPAFCPNCGAKFEETVMPKVEEQPAVTIEEVKAEQAPAQVQESLSEEKVVSGSYQPTQQPVATPVVTPTPVQPQQQQQQQQQQLQPQPQRQPQPPQQAQAQPIADYRDKPMTLIGWLGTLLLLMVPIVGFVMVFVWAFSSNTNRSKRTYFQAALILCLIGIVLGIVFGSALAIFISSLMGGMDIYQ